MVKIITGPISKEDVRRSPWKLFLNSSEKKIKGLGRFGAQGAPLASLFAPLGPALDPRTSCVAEPFPFCGSVSWFFAKGQ